LSREWHGRDVKHVLPCAETRLPESRNERPFAERVLALEFPEDNRPHFWFGRIPGCRDIDCAVWFPRNGLFVLELKSWPLSCIKRITTDGIDLDEGVRKSTSKPPWNQARDAAFTLKHRLVRDPDCRQELARLWLAWAVGLFNIRRGDFTERLESGTGASGGAAFQQLIETATVFQEDLDSGLDFLNRLVRAKKKPVYGAGAPQQRDERRDPKVALAALNGVLHPELAPGKTACAYDLERIRVLEEEQTRELDPLDWYAPVYCTGYAGTGKTLLGLQALLQRLQGSGERGLFVCFNKVLATDIGRLLQLSPAFRMVDLDVFDVFHLLRSLADYVNVPFAIDPQEIDASAARVCDRLFAAWESKALAPERPGYSLIVIDEAQDLHPWSWDLLDRLQGPGTEVMVIDAQQQQLYRMEKAEHLRTLRELVAEEARENFIEKRRVFRTTDTTFLISQLFADSYPSVSAARSRWEKTYGPGYRAARSRAERLAGGMRRFELPRVGGHAPRLHFCEPSQDDALRVTTILVRNAIAGTAKRFREDQPCGVLILVPFQKEMALDWRAVARDSCAACDLRYIDYSLDVGDRRRQAYRPDEVRICTFHSSKGIEGLHVIVLGYDSLGDAAPSDIKEGVNHLGYIVLSRSQYDTDIVCVRRDGQPRHEVEFLRSLMEIVGN